MRRRWLGEERGKAAEQGHAAAQYMLGLCYELGEGVEQDQVKAVEWYRKAAEQGQAVAHCSLGRCYAEGKEGHDDRRYESCVVVATHFEQFLPLGTAPH